MATTLSALLNIKANVTGEGPVKALGSAIGGIKGAAGQATGALKGLTGAAGMGGLAGAMGALTPLLSVAGLVGMAKSALSAGDAFYDMAQRTGVSVEMLAKFKKAASTSGTSIETVEKGLISLARSMKAAASVDLGGKTKEEIDQAVKAVEDGEKAQTRAIEREADRKMAALDRETDRRLSALNRRYRREEQLLKDSWDDQADAANDAADKQVDALLKAAERTYAAKRKAIENDKALSDSARDAAMQRLQDGYDAETDLIRDNAQKAQKERDRAARDAQQQVLDQLDERKTAEMEALKAKTEAEKTVIKDGARFQVDTIKDATAASIAVLKQDPGQLALEGELDDLGLSGKGASEAFRKMGISITDATGALRNPGEVMLEISNHLASMADGADKTALANQLLKKSGAELIPMLNMGGEAIRGLFVKMTGTFAAAADKYTDKMTALGGKIGAIGADIAITLLPALEAITDALLGFFEWMNKQDPIIKNLIATVGILSIAFVALAPTIAAIVSLVGLVGPAIGGLVAFLTGGAGLAGALATVSGALGAVVPFFTGLAATIAGFITWPVVLVAALVAAAVAIFVFRDKIGAFFQEIGKLIAGWVKSLWEWGEPIREFWVSIWDGLVELAAPVLETLTEAVGNAFATMMELAYQVFIEPYVKAWEGLQAVGGVLVKSLQDAWNGFATWIGGVFKAIGDTFRRVFVDPITNAFRFVVDTGKGALRSLMQWGANVVNSIIRVINRMIEGINRVRSALNLSTFGLFREVSVPAFAEGGFVSSPTLGLVGEAGNEYIVPERKAAAFASNYLAGARGAAAIPTSSSSGGMGPASVTVNLTTGPVLQQPDGTQAVALADVERLVRQGVSDTIRQLRTPAGRYAMGVR